MSRLRRRIAATRSRVIRSSGDNSVPQWWTQESYAILLSWRRDFADAHCRRAPRTGPATPSRPWAPAQSTAPCSRAVARPALLSKRSCAKSSTPWCSSSAAKPGDKAVIRLAGSSSTPSRVTTQFSSSLRERASTVSLRRHKHRRSANHKRGPPHRTSRDLNCHKDSHHHQTYASRRLPRNNHLRRA